ncbi:MAG: hypothetical protein WC055_12005 [Melioribacteraceae bacterium]
MSRSNPSEDSRTPNPAVKFFEWSGQNGNLTYYDKTEKKKIEVKLPFTFLPISRLVCLKGYNDDSKTSYWSNEVKDIQKDPFTVQSVTGGANNKQIRTVAQGLYKDIKPTLDSLDISYVESLYIGVKEANKLELCNFQIKGSAIGSWITFCKNNKIWEIAVSIKSSVDKKKGAVKYKEPVYTSIVKISEAMQKEAIDLDLHLNEYLFDYLQRNHSQGTTQATDISKPAVNEPKQENNASDKPAFDNSKPKEAQHVEVIDNGADITFAGENAPDEF